MMIGRVLIKTLVLLVVFNLVFAILNPPLRRLTLYGSVFPARLRLPFAANPSESYSVTLTRLEEMLPSHEIAYAKKADEYRVLLLGDSAVWGWLLEPDQTLSACLNRQNLRTSEGKTMHFYNLGYPVLDVTKDVLILQYALPYEPDMVVWLVTLAALYPDEQLFHPIVQHHVAEVRALISRYDLALDPAELPPNPNLWARTLIGGRRVWADWLRHQLYGVAWMMTGIDHRDPRFYKPVRQNLHEGTAMLDGTSEKTWQPAALSLDVVAAGVEMARRAGVEMWLVNEPIFISTGSNSDLRYNFYYPRWAYDRYRDLMRQTAAAQGWRYLDFWDAVPAAVFTDSALHFTPAATCQFAEQLGEALP